MKIITYDIQKILGSFEKTDQRLSDRIQLANLEYDELTYDEYIQYLFDYIKTLDRDLVEAGKNRISSWEDGWGENLQNYINSGDINDLVPKYHTKNNIARFNKKIIRTFTPNFDYHLNSFFIDFVLFQHIPHFNKIFEFGCGPAYHLFRLNQYFPNKEYVGLDWTKTSQEIIEKYSSFSCSKNIKGFNFDFFNPNYNIDISGGLVYTVAALEQIGESHAEILKYLVSKKPGLCIHFEPIIEVLNPDVLLDYLTIKYFEKRKYLKGFLPALEKLHDDGKIRIIDTKRLYSGSKYIEGHTLIIWKPL